MASPAATPAYVLTLYNDLYYEIGGPFHPERVNRYEKHPEHEIPDGASSLERWIKFNAKDQTGSLDCRFAEAVQQWVERQLTMLHIDKNHVSKIMEIASTHNNQSDRTAH